MMPSRGLRLKALNATLYVTVAKIVLASRRRAVRFWLPNGMLSVTLKEETLWPGIARQR